jgi:hypothetical protein
LEEGFKRKIDNAGIAPGRNMGATREKEIIDEDTRTKLKLYL